MNQKIQKIARGKLWLAPYWLLIGKANTGFCPICQKKTLYVKYQDWLRDHYRCVRCWSIPRQRAIITQLNYMHSPWPELNVHESSPGGVSSDYIAANSSRYLASHFFPDTPLGESKWGFQCEDLEKMTFEDETFDLVVTQDVMEHVFRPDKAFSEIARTLKPGGAHVFTVPIYKGKKTRIRARMGDSGIEYLAPPDYHGNPIDEEGSLVVTEWGKDIVDFIMKHSGLDTKIISFSDRQIGLEAEFLDVLVSTKPTEHSFNNNEEQGPK